MLNKIGELRNFLNRGFSVVGYDKKEDFFTLLSKCEDIIQNNNPALLTKEDINAMLMFLDMFREYCIFNVNSKDSMNMINTSMEVFDYINNKVKQTENQNVIDVKIEEVMRIMNCQLTMNESAAILRKLLSRIELASQYNPPSLELSHHYISTVLDGAKNEK